ncbi:EamA family transporter RarD [Haliangium sp.]|uniref:EamA family transporter RarD n=1 Tax=Haliangium sp. TaxID=2663208 RepID=UPI003D1531A2
MSTDRHSGTGLAYGLAAYVWWGMVPVFWKQITHIPAFELLGHRVVWGFCAFGAIAWMRGRWSDILTALRDRRTAGVIVLSALLLACNWLTFIYAVATDRVLHASLGYFINPIVSVLLGVLFLGERMRRSQWVALLLAAAGVAQYAAQAEALPWLSFVLAGSFGLYGLVRKTVRVDALPGSTLETLLMLPLGLAYLGVLAARGQGYLFAADGVTHGLLMASGLIGALPLLWFTNAARRLPLYVLGFLQYLAPSLQFAVAVLLYDEPFNSTDLRGFVCIWVGLLLFSLDTWWARRRRP